MQTKREIVGGRYAAAGADFEDQHNAAGWVDLADQGEAADISKDPSLPGPIPMAHPEDGFIQGCLPEPGWTPEAGYALTQSSLSRQGFIPDIRMEHPDEGNGEQAQRTNVELGNNPRREHASRENLSTDQAGSFNCLTLSGQGFIPDTAVLLNENSSYEQAYCADPQLDRGPALKHAHGSDLNAREAENSFNAPSLHSPDSDAATAVQLCDGNSHEQGQRAEAEHDDDATLRHACVDGFSTAAAAAASPAGQQTDPQGSPPGSSPGSAINDHEIEAAMLMHSSGSNVADDMSASHRKDRSLHWEVAQPEGSAGLDSVPPGMGLNKAALQHPQARADRAMDHVNGLLRLPNLAESGMSHTANMRAIRRAEEGSLAQASGQHDQCHLGRPILGAEAAEATCPSADAALHPSEDATASAGQLTMQQPQQQPMCVPASTGQLTTQQQHAISMLCRAVQAAHGKGVGRMPVSTATLPPALCSPTEVVQPWPNPTSHIWPARADPAQPVCAVGPAGKPVGLAQAEAPKLDVHNGVDNGGLHDGGAHNLPYRGQSSGVAAYEPHLHLKKQSAASHAADRSVGLAAMLPCMPSAAECSRLKNSSAVPPPQQSPSRADGCIVSTTAMLQCKRPIAANAQAGSVSQGHSHQQQLALLKQPLSRCRLPGHLPQQPLQPCGRTEQPHQQPHAFADHRPNAQQHLLQLLLQQQQQQQRSGSLMRSSGTSMRSEGVPLTLKGQTHMLPSENRLQAEGCPLTVRGQTQMMPSGKGMQSGRPPLSFEGQTLVKTYWQQPSGQQPSNTWTGAFHLEGQAQHVSSGNGVQSGKALLDGLVQTPLKTSQHQPSCQQPSCPPEGPSQTTLQKLQRLQPYIQEPSSQQPSRPVRDPSQTTLQTLQQLPYIQEPSSQQPSCPVKDPSQTTLQTLQLLPFIQEPSSGQQPSSPLKGPSQAEGQGLQQLPFIPEPCGQQPCSGQQPSSPLNGPSQAEGQKLPEQVSPLAQKTQRQPTSQGACMRTLRNLTKLPARQTKGSGGNPGASEERWQVGLEAPCDLLA